MRSPGDLLLNGWSLWIALVGAGGLTLYYGAIITGLFKEPLLANFRRYGEERRVYPLVVFLLWLGVTSISAGFLIRSESGSGPYGSIAYLWPVLGMASLMSFGMAVFVSRRPVLREALPLWYFRLLRTTTRQERRFIGFAWLRLPRKMRWRLNGDQRAFASWADMVRITVIYGAYDPDNPWDRWT